MRPHLTKRKGLGELGTQDDDERRPPAACKHRRQIESKIGHETKANRYWKLRKDEPKIGKWLTDRFKLGNGETDGGGGKLGRRRLCARLARARARLGLGKKGGARGGSLIKGRLAWEARQGERTGRSRSPLLDRGRVREEHGRGRGWQAGPARQRLKGEKGGSGLPSPRGWAGPEGRRAGRAERTG